MRLSILHSFPLLTASVYAAIGPSCNIHVANKFLQPDGFNRSTVLAGATYEGVSFPAPPILAVKGDHFDLNVIDQLTDSTMVRSTSIHWHGLFQERTNYADGPVGVSQCPIIPGNSFLYQFSVLDQAGTFWYHSHHSLQYCDGLRGAIVIYDPNDPYQNSYDVDNEDTIITLADWYHNTSVQAPLAVFDSTLINGLGRYASGPNSPLAVINVVQGKRYRFRLVSISCAPSFTFSIDGHNMTIIEVEGTNVHPLTVDSISIFAGQRYSFILTANQPVKNYWIRSLPSSGPTGFIGGINSAILRYEGAPDAEPTTVEALSTNPLVETNLHPLMNPAAPGVPEPGAADVNLNFDIGVNLTAFEFTVNNASFITPNVPVLLQIISGASTPQELLPPGSVYVLPPNKVIEISIPGGSPGSPHPIHLHGHNFAVIRSAGNSSYNFVNPVRRDVVSVGDATDNVTFRFETNNDGPWIMHCHINPHLTGGLAVVLAEDVPAIAQTKPPRAWDDLCPAYNAFMKSQPDP